MHFSTRKYVPGMKQYMKHGQCSQFFIFFQAFMPKNGPKWAFSGAKDHKSVSFMFNLGLIWLPILIISPCNHTLDLYKKHFIGQSQIQNFLGRLELGDSPVPKGSDLPNFIQKMLTKICF